MEKKNIALILVIIVAVALISGFLYYNYNKNKEISNTEQINIKNNPEIIKKKSLAEQDIIIRDVSLLSSEFESLFPNETKEYDFSQLKQYVDNNQVIINNELTKDINKTRDGFIGIGKKEWVFNTEVQDELNISIIQVGNNEFIIYPYSVNNKITNDVKYRWKYTLNVDENETILKQDMTSSDLNKPIFFSIPRDSEYFEMKIGATSTTINASSLGTATIHSPTDKFVRNSTGDFLVAFVDTNGDIVFGDSWNYGKNWRTKIAYTGTVTRVGLVDTPNGTLFISFQESSNILGLWNGDGGTTWGTPVTIADSLTLLGNPSCQSDSNNVIHCAFIFGAAGTATARYTNSSYWNGSNYDVINDNINNNTNEVDIEIDSNNQPIVVGIGTDFDCVDVWSTDFKGWGDTNRINLFCSISYVEGRASDLTVRTVNNVEQLYVLSTNRGGLFVSNTTLDKNQSWRTATITGSGIYAEPTSAITQRGWYVGLFTNNTVASADNGISMVNSTNFTTFSTNLSVQVKSGQAFPSIADSNFPTWNRADGTNGTIHYIYTETDGDVMYDNIRIPKENPFDTCTYSSGNWIVSCSDNCIITSNVNLGGNNIILSGTGTFTVNNGVQIRKFNNIRSDKTCYVRTNGNGGFLK